MQVHETHSKHGEGVRGDIESGEFNKLEEEVEIAVFENEFGERFVPDTLSQHHATVEGDLRILIPFNIETLRIAVTLHIIYIQYLAVCLQIAKVKC